LLRLMPIVAAAAIDQPDVRRLLDACGLPAADLSVALLRDFPGSARRPDLVAVDGLEFAR
jgi:hypothetical protein